MAMLNPDGTLDGTFVPREIGGGAVNFAQLIDKEKVIVSGTFSTYGGVPRLGFLILEMDGTAQQKFNVPGTFNGQLCGRNGNDFGLLWTVVDGKLRPFQRAEGQ